MKYLLIAILILCSPFSTLSETNFLSVYKETSDLNDWIDAQFLEGMNHYNVAGASFILMQGDSIRHINGYGLADIESNTPVYSPTSIFGIASISKTFVATAIMQLYENGQLELDQDINKYLNSFQIEYKFKGPITINHLLTHTAGFDVRNIGWVVRSEEDVMPLAKYLKNSMPPQIRPPGEVLTYSNHSYGLLGLIVEEVSGAPFDEYVKKMILEPLEMNTSDFKSSLEQRNNYVSSYLQKNNQLIPYKLDFQLNYPAGSFSSTASDMGNYISMFLNNGNFKGSQILNSTTIDKMHQTAFKHYEKAENGWLLGFTESHWKGVRLIRHGGDIQGFASELILIPDSNIGFFLSVNSSNLQNSRSRKFIYEFINNLLLRLKKDNVIENIKTITSPEIGSVEEPLETFTGVYRFTRYAQNTVDKLAVLIGIAPEIKIVLEDNKLKILEWNDVLTPISDLTFASIYSNKYLAFGRDVDEEISYFFDDTSSYKKLKWYEPVQFQIYWISSIVIIMSIFIIANIFAKLFIQKTKSHLIKRINFSIASLIIFSLSVLAFALIKTDPQEFLYGLPWIIKFVLLLPFLIILLEFIALYLLAKAIRYKEMTNFDLVYQSFIAVVTLFFIPWLKYYNLIGFNY